MEFTPSLFTKIVLLQDVDVTPIIGSTVVLAIDEAYTIGKSIAVLINETIIGHLDSLATKVVWRHIRSGTKLTAEVYPNLGNWRNKAWYSIMTHSFEVGIKVRFCDLNREDGKLLLAHIAKKKLNSFPGVAPCNCPEDLKLMVRPIKDENDVLSLLLSPHMI